MKVIMHFDIVHGPCNVSALEDIGSYRLHYIAAPLLRGSVLLHSLEELRVISVPLVC